MFSRAYTLLTKERTRRARCEELRVLITEHIMDNLPTAPHPDDELDELSTQLTVQLLVEALPELDYVDSVDALEMYLEHLKSLMPYSVSYSHFNDFLRLTRTGDSGSIKSGSATDLSPLFLCKAYLAIDGFAGDFDVQENVLGLYAYSSLEHLMCGDDGEAVSMALVKAALRLAEGKTYHKLIATGLFFPSPESEQVQGYFLEDRELAGMIAHNPERVDDIVEAVTGRGSFPGAEAVWKIIDADAKALSAGVL